MPTTQLEKTAEQAQHRSPEASIESIVSEHGPDLIAFARSLGASDPEGVANEVLTEYFLRSDHLVTHTVAERSSHLRHSADTLVTKQSRADHEQPTDSYGLSVDLVDESQGFEARIADACEMEQLLDLLTPGQRDVIRLRFVDDLSLPETARRLGKPLGTVKALQHRAMNRLRILVGGAVLLVLIVAAVVALRESARTESLQPISSREGLTDGTPDGAGEPNPLVDLSPDRSRPAVDAVRTGDRRSVYTSESTVTPTVPTSVGQTSTSTASPAPGPNTSPTSSAPTAPLASPSTISSPPAATAMTTTNPIGPSSSTPAIVATSVVEPTTTTSTLAVALPSGPVAIRSVATGEFLWARASDLELRANGSSATISAARFTIVPIGGSLVAFQATVGARDSLVGVQNDPENTLRIRGGEGGRPHLIAHRNSDGTYRFESALFPGRFLRVDRNAIDSAGTASTGPATSFELVSLQG